MNNEPEQKTPRSNVAGDLTSAAVAGAKGAASGGWVGAAKGAAVSLALSGTGRRVIGGVLMVALGVAALPAVGVMGSSLLVAALVGSDNSRTAVSLENSGLDDLDAAEAQAAVAGTSVPWEIYLAIRQVAPDYADDLGALQKALEGIDSLGSGATYDGEGGYVDGRTTSDQDNAAAEREAYVVAFVGMGMSEWDAGRIYDLAREWRLGTTERCDVGASPITITLDDGTQLAYDEVQSTNLRAALGAIREEDTSVLTAVVAGALTRTGARNVASNAEPSSLEYVHDELRDTAGLGIFAADETLGDVGERMGARIQGQKFRDLLAEVEGGEQLTPASMAAAVLGEGDYAAHTAAAALVVEQLTGPQVTDCGGVFAGELVLPLAPGTYTLTSGYGARGQICFPSGCTNSFHKGQDFSAACGVPIYSASSGTVTHSGTYPSWGWAVMVTDPLGVVHKYAHMPKDGLRVQVGETVSAGQQIGEVGNTGMSTGCHLHYETWLDGVHVDPRKYLESYGLEL